MTKKYQQFKKCFACGRATNRTYFGVKCYDSLTTKQEAVYLCHNRECKEYLLTMILYKDCPSHPQFSNTNYIPQTELNNHE